MKRLLLILPFASLLLPLTYSAPPNTETAIIQARMKERLKQVAQLKLSGLAGESNQGLISVVPDRKLDEKQKGILEDENRDRTLIYQLLAKKFDVPVKQVAMSRVVKIRKIAKAGTWLQQKDGKWIQKKE